MTENLQTTTDLVRESYQRAQQLHDKLVEKFGENFEEVLKERAKFLSVAVKQQIELENQAGVE